MFGHQRIYLIATGIVYLTLINSSAVIAEEDKTRKHHVNDVEFEEIVTTGTRTARTRSEVAIRTEVIGREMIDYSAARDLADVIEYLPGARTQATCQNCGSLEIQLLGLGGGYNQVLFDKQPLMSGLAAVYGVEQIPTLFVDKIEIVKGGGSVLYGANAVAGVINVIPRVPDRTEYRLSGTYENMKGKPLYNGSAVANFVPQSDKYRLAFYGMHQQNDAVDYHDDGYSEITKKNLDVIGTYLVFQPGDNLRVNVTYQFTDEFRRGGNLLDLEPHETNITEQLLTKNHRGGLFVDYDVSTRLHVRAGYSFALTKRGSYYGGLGDVVVDQSDPLYDAVAYNNALEISRKQYGDTDDKLHYFDSQIDYTIGDHVISSGFQYKVEKLYDENQDEAGNLVQVQHDAKFDNAGFFLQDEWSVSEKVKFVVGGRLDKNSEVSGVIISPRANIWYAPFSDVKIRTGISTGFRAPELFDEDLHVSTLGADQIRIFNRQNIREEKSVTMSAGIDWEPEQLDGRVEVEFQAYYTRLTNTFVLGEIQTGSDGSLSQERYNAEGSEIVGLELDVNLKPVNNINIIGGLFWSKARYDNLQTVFDDGFILLTSDKYLQIPSFSAAIQTIVRMTDTFDVFIGLKYTGSMDVLNINRREIVHTGDFIVADINFIKHMEWNTGHFDITLGVKNIFDQRQPDQETGALRDSAYIYGPRIPRTFYIRAGYDF